MPTIRESFQPMLRELLPSFFDSAAVEEKKATCDSCVMCAPPGLAKTKARDFFRDDIKCCTYFPSLPNFLVGAILADGSDELAEGASRVRRHIAGRVGITPQHVAPSRKYNVLLKGAYHNAFGRSETLRCPYYLVDGGRCTIWRYRNSHCASFYCKFDNAGDGLIYWRGVGSYWSLLEDRVAALCMGRVSSDVTEPERKPERLSLEELEDRPPSDADYLRWWGPWVGREEEFYRACHARACELTPNDAAVLLGDETARRRLRIIEGAYQQLHEPRFPDKLKLNPELTSVAGGDDVRLVVGYSRYEPLALPGIVYKLLEAFDGKSTVAEVQAKIRARDDADFNDALVLTMFQNRVLVDASERSSARGADDD